MKKFFPVFFLAFVFLMIPISKASAAILLDNYLYIDTNTVGNNQYLADKFGTTSIQGDANEHDGTITRVTFDWQGLSGETLYIIFPDGSTQYVSSQDVTLTKPSKYIRFALNKQSTKETFVRVIYLYVHDESDGGVDISYQYNNAMPTHYGDLGDGPEPTPTPTPEPTPTPTPDPEPSDPGNSDPVWMGLGSNQDGIVWGNAPSNVTTVKLYKDGQLVGSFLYGNKAYSYGGSPPDGHYTIYGLDSGGSIVARGEFDVGGNGEDPGGEDPGGNDPGDGESGDTPPCTVDGCDFLKQLLACPDWDLVMGDVTNAIKNALPPPPDWSNISDMIGAATVRHLSDYMGPVPDPPSKGDIQFELDTPPPVLDTSTDQLEPSVPPDYNQGKIVFDLNSTPGIDVPDESKPFRIDDPLANQKHDAPGVKVIPGDPRNNSDGIKPPDHPDTGDNTPKPSSDISGPIGTVPVPSGTTSDAPKPSAGSGVAIPDPTIGIIPIPSRDGG